MNWNFKRFAFITDFGNRDYYVGAMKGILLKNCPDATFLDLSHEIPPQDVLNGAQYLKSILPFLPDETLYLCIVDPTVGSSREAVAFLDGKKGFIGPNNGIFSLAFPEMESCQVIDSVVVKGHPQTFHGRDLFSPFAATWYNKGPFSLYQIAPNILDSEDFQRFYLPEPILEPGRIQGHISWVDKFGNCITNIPHSWIKEFSKNIQVYMRETQIVGLHSHYNQVESGELLALSSSENTLELALRDGSFAEAFDPPIERFETAMVFNFSKQ